MPEMQHRRMTDQLGQRLEIASGESWRVLLEELEELRIANERRFDGFGCSASPVPIRQRGEKRAVINDRKRRRECPEVVFLAERVDAILDANGRIVLRQNRRRHTDETDTAMRGC